MLVTYSPWTDIQQSRIIREAREDMNSELIPAVAEAVRHFRSLNGVSQEALADRAGLDRTYISGVERGVRNITLQSLEQIIRALGISTESFFTRVFREGGRDE